MTGCNDDEAAIRDLLDKTISAELAGDANAWASLAVEDAILLPQQHATIVGARDIRKFWEEAFDQVSLSDIEATAEEVRVAGDWAYLRVSYSHTATRKIDGNSEKESGKSVWIAGKQKDGSWKFTRAIWNTDV